jgi:hypothetical protein
MRKSILLATALVVASMSSAVTALGDTPAAKRLQRFPVAEYVSTPGESQPEFLARVGRAMRTFSDQTGFESCGSLASDVNDTFGIRIYTVRSHIGCVTDRADVPAGLEPLGQTLHTHGTRKTFFLNPADIVMGNGDLGSGKIRTADPNHFSPDDYDRGQSFLATETQVLYQHGAGTATAVAELRELPDGTLAVANTCSTELNPIESACRLSQR